VRAMAVPLLFTGQFYLDASGMAWGLWYVPQQPDELLPDAPPDALEPPPPSSPEEEPKSEGGRLPGELLQLAFAGDAESRFAQLELMQMSPELACEVAKDLNVEAAIRSPHANYFLQTLLTAHREVAVEVLEGQLQRKAHWAARHRFGCRVFCRLAEISEPGSVAEKILLRLLSEGGTELAFKEFARHVVITCLGSGSSALVEKALEIARSEPWNLAGSRWGRLLLEKAIEVDTSLAQELGSDMNRLSKLQKKSRKARFLVYAVRKHSSAA